MSHQRGLKIHRGYAYRSSLQDVYPVFYEFRVILPANVLQLVCYTVYNKLYIANLLTTKAVY